MTWVAAYAIFLLGFFLGFFVCSMLTSGRRQ
jgi:hypothetical protein